MHDMTAPELRRAEKSRLIALLPLGSTEQHGPHLPCDTDTFLINEIAKEAESRRGDKVMLLPSLWLGHSPHHMSFGGTLTVDYKVYIAMVSSICESLIKQGFNKILLLNGHGGNRMPASCVLQEMKDRYPEAKVMLTDYWSAAAEKICLLPGFDVTSMGHACELETSLYLYLAGNRVKKDLIKNDGHANCPADEKFSSYMMKGSPLGYINNFSEITETGVFGKPERATQDKGKFYFEVAVEAVVSIIDSILNIGD